jgi:hypothetical protein
VGERLPLLHSFTPQPFPFLPYSPKCLEEGVFSEVRRTDCGGRLRNRTNPTRRYKSTKNRELRFEAQLIEGAPELELAVV